MTIAPPWRVRAWRWAIARIEREHARAHCQELLRELGHEVRLASDGPTAINLANEWHADVIFIDIGLPGMDGYEVARQIRKQDSNAKLVALTGYGHEGARAMSVDAGFSQHLVKPPAIDTVISVLEGVGPASTRSLN